MCDQVIKRHYHIFVPKKPQFLRWAQQKIYPFTQKHAKVWLNVWFSEKILWIWFGTEGFSPSSAILPSTLINTLYTYRWHENGDHPTQLKCIEYDGMRSIPFQFFLYSFSVFLVVEICREYLPWPKITFSIEKNHILFTIFSFVNIVSIVVELIKKYFLFYQLNSFIGCIQCRFKLIIITIHENICKSFKTIQPHQNHRLCASKFCVVNG